MENKDNVTELNVAKEDEEVSESHGLSASRKDLQIPRRLFHMFNGSLAATAYLIFFDHSQMIFFIGAFASSLYITEQIRVNYPEASQKMLFVTKYIIRAEEALQESAVVPYAIAILLTIITFPKILAITAVYTLALADPMSALVGIKYGKRRIVKHKSLEGSAAFFVTTFMITFTLFGVAYDDMMGKAFVVSLLLSITTTIFEMIPLRLDDNLTIPLFTAAMGWILCLLVGIPLVSVI